MWLLMLQVLFFLPPPFILLTDNDDSCYSIEKFLGQYHVSGISI